MSKLQVPTKSTPVASRKRKQARQPVLTGLIVAVAVILVAFVIYPLYSVLKASLYNDVGQYVGLANYVTFIGSPYFRQVLYNTLIVSGLTTAGAVLLGTIFAYAVVRTDIPGRKLFAVTGILPMITPPFVNAFAFILLFGRMGVVSRFVNGLLGTQWTIYGWHGIIVAEIVTFFPLAYLVASAALSGLDPSVEQAAYDLGAKDLKVLRTITLPLITPALLAGGLLTMMSSLSAFGAPALLGGGYSVLAVESVLQTLGIMDWGMGTTTAIILLIPTVAVFFWQQRFRTNTSYVTVTGAPTHYERRPTPPVLKWPLFVVCALVSILVLAIFVTVLAGSVAKVWGVDASWTVQHYSLVFRRAGASILSTLRLSLIGALFATFFGLLNAYLFERLRFTGRRGLDFLATLPYAVPGTMMGLGFVVAFNKAPLILTGTASIIILDFTIRRMPFALRSGVATLRQIDVSLEEASADLGARWGRTFRRIVLPLMKPAFIGGFTFAFIRAMTELTSTIFLVSPSNRLMSVDIYNYVSSGALGEAAALSCVLIGTVLAVLGVVYKLTGLTISNMR